ncbi:MAG: hypothetical protein QOF16_214, partial [Actinomycetota bacterium]|nr:hypothetical protein [Actinomycetota bacterium]
LRAELSRTLRSHDELALMILDVDDFKKVNDVHGHHAGDQLLMTLAEMLRGAVRGCDVVCRFGGDEFAVIMPSCNAGDALGLASRLRDRLKEMSFDVSGSISVSIGIAQGPEHASNPRELVACADAALLTAKARKKDCVILFDETSLEHPEGEIGRDVRSIAHLKMLQSLAGKLTRLTEVRQIGITVVDELRTLIDYHNCRVYLAEGDDLIPIAVRGEFEDEAAHARDLLGCKVGEGITGRAAATGRSVLVRETLDCTFAEKVSGTKDVSESMIATPLMSGSKVIGVVVISKLGVGQLDEDDVRMLEVLSGHAAIAVENARLYETQRREAQNARSLLEFSDRSVKASSFYAIADETIKAAVELLDATSAAMWLQNDRSKEFVCASHTGYIGDAAIEPSVKLKFDSVSGEGFLVGRQAPFILEPIAAERFFPLPQGAQPRTLAIAPLLAGDGLKGWITVREPAGSSEHFTEERMRLLETLSYQASAGMRKALLYKDQKETADIANALLDFGSELASAEGLDQVLTRTVELAARILGCPRVAVMLQEVETGDLLVEALWGFDDSERHALTSVRFPAAHARDFLSPDKPFSVRPEELGSAHPIRSVISDPLVAVAPLKLDGRVGALVAGAPAYGDYEFSERKMKLLAGIANQAVLAVSNANNFEILERTFLSTVEALANALEAKDEYTSSHARSITDMALEVGTSLSLDPRTLKRLELGALFHDIGKIGIPSDILLKPGPLTDDERKVIETHPELGERILAPIERLEDVRPIVRHCHEHFDGTGYPDGRKGDEIPVESRIILVCDAFHAMTTDRPYRKRLPQEEALSRLEEASGKQFDPRVVRAFVRLVRAEGIFHPEPESVRPV